MYFPCSMSSADKDGDGLLDDDEADATAADAGLSDVKASDADR